MIPTQQKIVYSCVFFIAILLLMPFVRAEMAPEQKRPTTQPIKTIRVLAVGNSFSRDAMMNVSDFAEAAGYKFISAAAIMLSGSLEDHMRGADAFESDGPAHIARPYGRKSLKEMLAAEPWDIVTIQQNSLKSFVSDSLEPHAGRLIEYIRRHAPQAEIVVHQTWAYRDDHQLFTERDDLDTDRMYAGLCSAYDGLAKTYGLRQIPSGDAMQAARLDPAWGRFIPDPDFDPHTAVHPALPKAEKRSLHRNFYWIKNSKTGEHTIVHDSLHANSNGHYLLACVWFEFLFGQSVLDNPYVSPYVDSADAVILRRIAHKVVTEKYRPKTVSVP